ncbi:MAG: TfoX/Sxy family protein [Actinomycetota bacterium]|nr:TfoX/Sxy family protein [Actinomycetota bacterium]
MAYDEDLAERVRAAIGPMKKTAEISMFGGLCFTVNRNMFAGVMKDDLMVRVGPDAHDAALKQPGARPMDFAKRPMKGYIYVDKTGTTNARSLAKWVRMGSDFALTLPAKTPKTSGKRKTSSKNT